MLWTSVDGFNFHSSAAFRYELYKDQAHLTVELRAGQGFNIVDLVVRALFAMFFSTSISEPSTTGYDHLTWLRIDSPS
ncbi:hypothetical protein VTO73DRAFT_971 [Trametes versicolor]